MDPSALASLRPPDTELVLGLVAAVGTDLDHFQSVLTDYLGKFRYEVEALRLTDTFKHLDMARMGYPTDASDACTRIAQRMDAGNFLRQDQERGDVLALHAAYVIHQRRKAKLEVGKPCCDAKELSLQQIIALRRTAYVVRQLKHPEEVNTLRRIYGQAFHLIGLYSTKKERSSYLTKRKNGDPAAVELLMERDEREDDPLGQKTRDTFALADVFIRVGPNHTASANDELERFLNLVFGHPYSTPTRDEHRMYLAFGSSLRSADLSRQVGAVICDARGDVIATGSNDVPCAGGGQYWPEGNDRRDFELGEDANVILRNQIVVEIMRQFRPEEQADEVLLREGSRLLQGTRVRDLIEFSRAVHAEMDALTTCARIGVSPRGGTLYCTTFPCHICAKHIVAAGISRVVYIEPYAKSLAKDLHGDAIALEEELEVVRKLMSQAREQGLLPVPKVMFEPFVGVGPRRFPELFATKLGNGYPVKRKGKDGRTLSWEQAEADLRVPNMPSSFVERELFALSSFRRFLEKETR